MNCKYTFTHIYTCVYTHIFKNSIVCILTYVTKGK